MQQNELMHYGVKGMKWGQRRAQKRAERADRAIRRINTTREANKVYYKNMQQESRDKYSGKKPGKLERALARDKAVYDTTEVDNKYFIASQKAKKDKEYKKTTEYKKAKAAYSKQTTQRYIYGEWGHQRIETLKNTGYSEKKAKGRVFAEEVAAGVVTSVGVLAISALMNDY